MPRHSVSIAPPVLYRGCHAMRHRGHMMPRCMPMPTHLMTRYIMASPCTRPCHRSTSPTTPRHAVDTLLIACAVSSRIACHRGCVCPSHLCGGVVACLGGRLAWRSVGGGGKIQGGEILCNALPEIFFNFPKVPTLHPPSSRPSSRA